jgi:hypothetical protein
LIDKGFAAVHGFKASRLDQVMNQVVGYPSFSRKAIYIFAKLFGLIGVIVTIENTWTMTVILF